MVTPPILDNKCASMPSVFVPSALLREARRQKGLDTVDVPAVCILDPDGDLVRQLRQTGKAKPFTGWPCYHTELDTFDLGGHQVGIVGRVVGASFAVLVAEEAQGPLEERMRFAVARAEASIDGGAAANVLKRWVELSTPTP